MAKKPSAKSKAEKFYSAEEKIARLLGLLVVQKMEQKTDQALLLKSAGFQNSEIGELLDMSDNHVSVTLYQARKKPKRR